MKISRRRLFLIVVASLGTLALFLAYGMMSYISASEFWPISLSKHVFFANFERDPGLILKPSFHFILGLIYFLPLDNWQHIMAARILFSTLGFLSIFIFGLLFRRLALKQVGLTWMLLVAGGMLFLSPSFLSQVVKVRSDMLSLFFGLCVLAVGTLALPPYSSGKRFLALVVLNLALLGSTPRAIFHEIVVLLFLVSFHWQTLRLNRDARIQYLIAFGMPIIGMALVFFKYVINAPIFEGYLKQSYATGFLYFGYVVAWVKSDYVGSLVILVGFVFAVVRAIQFKIEKSDLPWILAFFGAAFGILFADLRSPFLIASFYPFLLAPGLMVIARQNVFRGFAPKHTLSVLILLWLIQQGPLRGWELIQSNIYQKDIIQKLSLLMQQRPRFRYFDGLGLLPRSKQIRAYLGPNDAVSLESALQRVQVSRPQVILYTNRTRLLGPEIDRLLDSDYDLRGQNLYIRKDVRYPVDEIQFLSAPILSFDL